MIENEIDLPSDPSCKCPFCWADNVLILDDDYTLVHDGGEQWPVTEVQCPDCNRSYWF